MRRGFTGRLHQNRSDMNKVHTRCNSIVKELTIFIEFVAGSAPPCYIEGGQRPAFAGSPLRFAAKGRCK